MFYHFIYPLSEYMSALNVFRYITVRSAFAAITAFVLTLVIGDFVIKKLKQMKVRQTIREDGPKKHRMKQGTPTMGGIMILFSFIVSIAMWGRFDNSYVWIVIVAAVLFAAIGFIDDYMKLKIGTRGMPAKVKLMLQFVFALVVIGIFIRFSGNEIPRITGINIPFIKDPFYLPMWVYVIFTAVVIAGWSNAVNLTDGLDGLATGLSLFVFVTLVIMAYIIGNV
ncbi:MAG TPA: phospho-N-acetylmuramoyl-pentapeptide-transferase, partial [Firmicutes bacterium]|nr:phospho-N-acetylmuramoyl-pentapeptide-transferase [Bacillota bacterium]